MGLLAVKELIKIHLGREIKTELMMKKIYGNCPIGHDRGEAENCENCEATVRTITKVGK